MRVISIAILLLLLSLTAVGATIEGPVPTDAALAGVDELVREIMAEWRVPGVAVAIVHGGDVVFSRGYGVRHPDTGAPVTSGTLFPIASLTKSFTSYGAAVLVDEGRLSLDEPVREYVRGFGVSDAAGTLEITMRDLLSHRSGIGFHDFLAEDRGLTREELIQRLPHLPAAAPLRTRWLYSNLGYGVAAHVIEAVAGEPWESFMRERIFRPLGMARTHLGSGPPDDPEVARAVVWQGGRYVTIDPVDPSPARAPAGGIYSTADDMARWMIVHLSGDTVEGAGAVSPETLLELHRLTMPETTIFRPDPDFSMLGYGLGWFVHRYRGEPLLTHGGNNWGYSATLGLLPERGLGVVVLSNQDSSQSVFAIMRAIVDRFLGAPERPWSSELVEGYRQNLEATDGFPQRQAGERAIGTVPSRPLGAYVGTYGHPGYGTVEVTCQGDLLRITGSGETSPLAHWQYDVFVAGTDNFMGAWNNDGWRRRVSFAADPLGRIAFLTISGVPDTWFARELRRGTTSSDVEPCPSH
jgi:CubicO group peptidase (beta-lactamase class C family)